jgi:hypothetical protein
MKDIDKYILRADNDEQAILLSEQILPKALWYNMPDGTIKRCVVVMNCYGAFFSVDAQTPEHKKRNEAGDRRGSLNLSPEEADIFCAAWLKYRSVNQKADE